MYSTKELTKKTWPDFERLFQQAVEIVHVRSPGEKLAAVLRRAFSTRGDLYIAWMVQNQSGWHRAKMPLRLSGLRVSRFE
jgi:hypothetical protein